MAKYNSFRERNNIENIDKGKVSVDAYEDLFTATTSKENIHYAVCEEEKLPSALTYAEKEKVNNLSLLKLQQNLENSLRIIDDEVFKGYVTKIDVLPIVALDNDKVVNLKKIHFFKISTLVYQEDEFSVDKLSMVFGTLSSVSCTIVLLLKSDGEKTDFFLGVRPNDEKTEETLFQMLKHSLSGFFPGSKMSEYRDEDLEEDLAQTLLTGKVGSISSVTCVADYKQNQDNITNKEFFQGLEKFVYTMRGKEYSAFLIADSISHEELMNRKHEYEKIYTQISPFSNIQMNFTVSDGKSESEAEGNVDTLGTAHTDSVGKVVTKTDSVIHSKGINTTIGTTDMFSDTDTDSTSKSDGETHTKGFSDVNTHTVTKTMSVGVQAGVNGVGVSGSYSRSSADSITHTESVSDSVSSTLTHGFSRSHGTSQGNSQSFGANESDSKSRSVSIGENTGNADTYSNSFSLSNTSTVTDSFGSSKGFTLNSHNMTLELVLKRLERHLERIDEYESFGMWNFAAYFIGETATESNTAANVYKSVIAGTNSSLEQSAINSWNKSGDVNELFHYVRNFIHPKFVYKGFSYDDSRLVEVNPAALVNTKELAIHMGLPRHSVCGLPVIEHAQFAQDVITSKQSSDKKINIGKIFDLGQELDSDVLLDVDSLAMHTFVAGSTGSGKSNTVYKLINELSHKNVPFLIVEPAKGEYRKFFNDPAIGYYSTSPFEGKMLKINPFSFPKGIHVLEHIDRIIEIFNVCWPMYAAMPAVLKEAVELAYKSAGWDLDLSENTFLEDLFPTFDDVLRELRNTIKESDYSSDTKGDYIGALSTRLKSLTNGINGRIFVSDATDLTDLFDQKAIVDISTVGAMETKSLLMGIIVLKLQEYRKVSTREINVPLKHITVLEEAHNLLKKTSTEQNADSANIVGKSVEMLTNIIAEIRSFGEGFIIVDQAPNLLDTAVIRNTNTKIVMRLPENKDREITGGSISLSKKQYNELSKLPTGVAAIYQNDWHEAVLCKIPFVQQVDFNFKKDTGSNNTKKSNNIVAMKAKNDRVLHLLLKKQLTNDEQRILVDCVKLSNVSAKIRKDILFNIDKKNRTYEWALADFINKNYRLEDVFRGTSKCCNLEHLCLIMKENISEEFDGFNDEEMFKIMYYICRIEHEKHPDNIAIEKLRMEYLREKVM